MLSRISSSDIFKPRARRQRGLVLDGLGLVLAETMQVLGLGRVVAVTIDNHGTFATLEGRIAEDATNRGLRLSNGPNRLRPGLTRRYIVVLKADVRVRAHPQSGSQSSTIGKTMDVIESRFADVNGARLHYLIAGKGDPVLLLHGYAQNSHMWRPLIPELARTHTVIAPDLRGFGDSAKPERGYDKKSMAQDIHALAGSLGHTRIGLAGHDIGLMVAYAYAAQYPAEVERIALMDAFLPGVGDWTTVWLMRDLWHFHFYGKTPLALVEGRERIYFEHFWNDFAADPSRFRVRAGPPILCRGLRAARRDESGL